MNNNTPMDAEPFDQRPDPDQTPTPLEAFHHLFQVDKFTWETDSEYEERKIVREGFISQLAAQGYTPSDFLAQLQVMDIPVVRTQPIIGTPILNKLIKRL